MPRTHDGIQGLWHLAVPGEAHLACWGPSTEGLSKLRHAEPMNPGQNHPGRILHRFRRSTGFADSA